MFSLQHDKEEFETASQVGSFQTELVAENDLSPCSNLKNQSPVIFVYIIVITFSYKSLIFCLRFPKIAGVYVSFLAAWIKKCSHSLRNGLKGCFMMQRTFFTHIQA